MSSENIKTFRTSFSLKYAYLVNSIIYSIKQLPILKRILPSSIYQNRGIKRFANVIAGLWEIISTFVGKALYLLIMIFLPLNLFEALPRGQVFLHLFFVLTLIGSYMNTYMFNPSKDKYYAMFLLRMDAKKYTLVNYGYSILKVIIGFLLILGALSGVSLWVCAMLPFFVAGTKMLVAALGLMRYKRTGKHTNENLPRVYGWSLVVILLAVAYGLPLLGILIPTVVIHAFMVLLILCGILAGRYILAFDAYREMYQPLLAEQRQTMDKAKNAAKHRSIKGITYEGEVESRRRGFEYLNELFLKRHRKILWGPSSKVTVISLGSLVVLGVAVVVNPLASGAIHSAIPKVLPILIFGMYAINRGTQFTQALFMNCDRSLLSYSFFKEPKNIVRLFAIRLREIMKVNLLPASVIGIGISALFYLSGGASNPWHYFVIPVYIMALSIFFSVHYLMLYYLMQPYNAGTKMKSGTYKVAIGLTYLLCYAFFWLNIEFNIFFAIVAIGFCMIYSIVACVLVYKLAGKTFRIRN